MYLCSKKCVIMKKKTYKTPALMIVAVEPRVLQQTSPDQQVPVDPRESGDGTVL